MRSLLGHIRSRHELIPMATTGDRYRRLSWTLYPHVVPGEGYPLYCSYLYAAEDGVWVWRRLSHKSDLITYYKGDRDTLASPVEPQIRGDLRYVVERLGEQGMDVYLRPRRELMDPWSEWYVQWISIDLYRIRHRLPVGEYLPQLCREIDEWVAEYRQQQAGVK